MTYKQAYDKIIEAYFNDKIRPYNACFCFCGVLCGEIDAWFSHFNPFEHKPHSGYTGRELFLMEEALLNIVKPRGYYNDNSKYENDLFLGMSAALDVLKQIYIGRGEIIDEPITFIKRQKV